ncbi:GtrA family protein [Coralliovum pocilloporae]|uniref:GtrA family protein n=1 Tax=Coralliovum pocilloporae TaxID=3066369 RepID=UPI0033076AAB
MSTDISLKKEPGKGRQERGQEGRLIAALRSLAVEFTRFVLSGSVAAFVNLFSRWLLNHVMPFEAAVVLAYLIGMVVAFLMFQRVIFRAGNRDTAGQVRRFLVVHAVGITQVYLISWGLADYGFPAIGWTWHAEDIAHFIGVATPAFSSYIGHKFYTFR